MMENTTNNNKQQTNDKKTTTKQQTNNKQTTNNNKQQQTTTNNNQCVVYCLVACGLFGCWNEQTKTTSKQATNEQQTQKHNNKTNGHVINDAPKQGSVVCRRFSPSARFSPFQPVSARSFGFWNGAEKAVLSMSTMVRWPHASTHATQTPRYMFFPPALSHLLPLQRTSICPPQNLPLHPLTQKQAIFYFLFLSILS
jgi:hypothetical protein